MLLVVRNSKLIFHVVTLLLCLALHLSYGSWQEKSAPGTGECPIPCRGARGSQQLAPAPCAGRLAGNLWVWSPSDFWQNWTPTQGSLSPAVTPIFPPKPPRQCCTEGRNQPKSASGHAHFHRALTRCVSASLLSPATLDSAGQHSCLPAAQSSPEGTWQSFRKARGKGLMESKGKFLYESSSPPLVPACCAGRAAGESGYLLSLQSNHKAQGFIPEWALLATAVLLGPDFEKSYSCSCVQCPFRQWQMVCICPW